MADHCTRRLYRGTPCHNNPHPAIAAHPVEEAPIVGLLFGTLATTTTADADAATTRTSDTATGTTTTTTPSTTTTTTTTAIVTISDAEDVPIAHQNNNVNSAPSSSSSQITTAIELHQAVYTNHVVVGWYRVQPVVRSPSPRHSSSSSNDEPPPPTADDLQWSQELRAHYASSSSSSAETPFLFALLHVSASPSTAATAAETDRDNSQPPPPPQTATTTTHSSIGNNKDNHDQIPLSLYVVDPHESVLVGLDYHKGEEQPSTLPSHHHHFQWKLVTAPNERIAVERIMQSNHHHNNNSHHQNSTALGLRLQPSLSAIDERLDTLERALRRLVSLLPTVKTMDPSTLTFLRHVTSLLYHVDIISSIQIPSTTTTTQLLQQLVTLSDTISYIQQYTDQCHVVQQYQQDTTTPAATAIPHPHLTTSTGNNNSSAMEVTTTSRQHARSGTHFFPSV